MFTWDKDDLNDEQEKAITEQDNVLLIACPGSGKTRTLAYKIAYELNRLQSDRKFIVAITYTNIAAEEIKERVELLGADTNQLWIGTIHAFCLEWILRPYSLYVDELKGGFRILNSHESESIISGLCIPYSDRRISHFDCGYIAGLEGYNRTTLDNAKKPYVKLILDEYFKILKANGQIDFEQILYYSYQLLKGRPQISSILSKLFSFVLIDEYQDTKLIQYHIISLILNAGRGQTKTLIVGDPNQSIYESLGGFPMPKSQLDSLIGFTLKELSLSKNYRSSHKVIRYFDFYKTYDNAISPSGINKDYPSIITFNNAVSRSGLVDEIARLIQYNIDLSISPNEICIIAPQWIHLAVLTRSLMVKMPDHNFNGPGMAPFARDIDNFWYKLARIILTEPSPTMYIRRLRWSKEILDDLAHAGIHPTEISNKLLLKICNSLSIDETEGLKYLEIAFNQICEKLNFSLIDNAMLLDHYKSFFDSSTARIERLKQEGNTLVDSIANFRKVFKQRDGITISSIHGVKGAEYDTVIAFGLLENLVPHFNDTNGQANAKKLLYVLSSRARKNIHLIAERGHRRNTTTTLQLQAHTYAYDT